MTVTEPAVVKVQDNVEEPEPPVIVVAVSVQAELSAASATSPVNPLMGDMVMVEVPGEPTATVTVVGAAVIVKSARPVMV